MGPSTGSRAGERARVAARLTVDRASHDTTSIMATIERRFGLRPLTDRDRRVQDLRRCSTDNAGPCDRRSALVGVAQPEKPPVVVQAVGGSESPRSPSHPARRARDVTAGGCLAGRDERRPRPRSARRHARGRHRAAAPHCPTGRSPRGSAALLVLAGAISSAGARDALEDLGPTVAFAAALLVLADGCRRAGLSPTWARRWPPGRTGGRGGCSGSCSSSPPRPRRP